MPLTYNGNTPSAVTYNGNPVSKVTYNGNVVFGGSPQPPAPGSYVAFYAPSSFSLGTSTGSATWDGDMEYSVDGTTWTLWDGSSISAVESGGYYMLYLRGSYGTVLSNVTDTMVVNGNDVQYVGNVLNLLEYTDITDVVLGGHAFRNAIWIKDVVLPAGVIVTSNRTFMGCTGMTSMNAQITDTSIVASFCDGCSSLETVSLSSSIHSFGQNAFKNCTSLRSMTLHSTTPPTLGSNALSGVPADCAIFVPSTAVATYQAASGWSDRSAYIQAIP